VAARLDGSVLEVAGIVDVEEARDALGAREDVVADARVRIALDRVEEQRGAAVEVLLDGRDFEMGVHLDVGGDELADRVEIVEGRAQAGDVLLHRLLRGSDTAPAPTGSSRLPGCCTLARIGSS